MKWCGKQTGRDSCRTSTSVWTGRCERAGLSSQDTGSRQGLRHPAVRKGYARSRGDSSRGAASLLGDRWSDYTTYRLSGESEGSQVGGGGLRVDEDGGRIPAHAVSGSGAYRAGGILRRCGLQPGANDEPAIVSADSGGSVGVICPGRSVRTMLRRGLLAPQTPLRIVSLGAKCHCNLTKTPLLSTHSTAVIRQNPFFSNLLTTE